jgi:hypothetical protein
MFKQNRKRSYTWLVLFFLGSMLSTAGLMMIDVSWLKYTLIIVGSGSLLLSLGLQGN